MSWKISKQFNFAYGHRVWVQKLESEFALERKCVCRHLHGHEAEVHVHLEGDELDPQGMVTDFLHLSWLKKFFDETVDHKFIIDKNDPLFTRLTGGVMDKDEAKGLDVLRLEETDDVLLLNPIYVPGTEHLAGHIVNVYPLEGVEAEYYESFFVVDFIPTSENLSKWVYDLTTPKMAKLGVKVSEVEWWETPKSCSRYSG